jgi:translation initiation factor 2B subunit (eIF-2B alpha/beta/delta family)
MNNVNHPSHYTSHPSGIETIEITEHMGFSLGNAIKYIMRADHKGEPIEDLKKAAWYINREITRRNAAL